MTQYQAFQGKTPLKPGGKLIFGLPTKLWLTARAKRLRRPVPTFTVVAPKKRALTPRVKGKAWMTFYGHNALSLYYAQIRPVLFAVFMRLGIPAKSDCSGTTTACFKYAGAPDPNGYGYDPNRAWTGYIRAHLARRGHVSECLVMDPIVYGRGQNNAGDHVAMVYEPGPDPLMFSHGQYGASKFFRHSAELAYHGGYCTIHNAGVA